MNLKLKGVSFWRNVDLCTMPYGAFGPRGGAFGPPPDPLATGLYKGSHIGEDYSGVVVGSIRLPGDPGY